MMEIEKKLNKKELAKYKSINIQDYIKSWHLIQICNYLTDSIIEFELLMKKNVYDLLDLYKYKFAYNHQNFKIK